MSFDKDPVNCSSDFKKQLALLWKGLKAYDT